MIQLNKEFLRDKLHACWIGKNIGGTIGGPYEWSAEILDGKGFSAHRKAMRMYVDHQQEQGDHLSFTITATDDLQAMNRVIVEADVLGHPTPVLFALPILGK